MSQSVVVSSSVSDFAPCDGGVTITGTVTDVPGHTCVSTASVRSAAAFGSSS
ncbi:hypothetical protein [Haloarcula vallismortis]|uniref:hypothetical protein n=1 Tax=Haloarcula vallismortis TaxID=28442 RepID=UPI00135F113F|nr:hypothetical protein [Haloarcula vallismortis]